MALVFLERIYQDHLSLEELGEQLYYLPSYYDDEDETAEEDVSELEDLFFNQEDVSELED